MDARLPRGEPPDETSSDQDGYDSWLRAKVEQGLSQSRDRRLMIPVEELWSDPTFEG